MNTLQNEVTIKAPLNQIWENLSITDKLHEYDPTVKHSKATSSDKYGIGATRKVDMLDNKNWFEEECTQFEPGKKLEYTLTACSFPVHNLKHHYSFKNVGDGIKVTQNMQIKMKYGLIGKVMFALLKPKWNSGNKAFLNGLKGFSENNH